MSAKTVGIIGGGPAGLFAAEILSAAGIAVHVYDRKPSVARKFLMAGRGGLNLTHSENAEQFVARYGPEKPWIAPVISGFTPTDMQHWADGLGAETFVGSSGRVFPKAFKASPLLRAWLFRLNAQGVVFQLQHEWQGQNDQGEQNFKTPSGIVTKRHDAVLLALGGASWPSLGSDGAWARFLPDVTIASFRPANCGFVCAWSEIFRAKFAGKPLKNISIRHDGLIARGDAMIDANGLEGGAVYAVSRSIREAIEGSGHTDILLDLRPDIAGEKIRERVSRGPGRQSFSTFLQKSLSFSPIETGLLREVERDIPALGCDRLANLVKNLPLRLTAPFPLDRAISSAGGLARDELNDDLMLRRKPGVFCAGEMLDWEAPTGGYLLQACFATGKRAADGILRWLNPR